MNLWSVTTLQDMGLGINGGLDYWGKERVAEEAYDKFDILQAYRASGDKNDALDWLIGAPRRNSNKAKARGSELHTAAEKLALGQTPEVDDAVLPLVEQYQKFLNEFRPIFHLAEAPVYNPTVGYAGTCDGIIELDGKRLLFDIKTTEHGPDARNRKGNPKSRPPHDKVALQLVAYRRAEYVGLLSERRYSSGRRRYYVFDPDAHHEPMPETDGAVAIVVSPVDYTVTPVRTDDTVWNAWRHVMEVARWHEFTARSVFGPQITPPTREDYWEAA